MHSASNAATNFAFVAYCSKLALSKEQPKYLAEGCRPDYWKNSLKLWTSHFLQFFSLFVWSQLPYSIK